MARYKVKTRTLVTDIDGEGRLRHLGETGVLAPDSQIKTLPDGPWTPAIRHPALAGLRWPARDLATGDLIEGAPPARVSPAPLPRASMPQAPAMAASHAPMAAVAGSRVRNQVVVVNINGRLIGLVAGSATGSLQRVIDQHNARGWRVVQVLPYGGGNLTLKIIQAVVLLWTCFLWTFGAGWVVIFEHGE